MRASNQNDWFTKIYLVINNFDFRLGKFQNRKVLIKKDWWLAVAILEGIRSLDLFVIYAKMNRIHLLRLFF